MTVEENLDLGAFLRKDREAIAADKERVLELFPRVRERLAQKAGTMSGGEQQMLAVGRALMGSPRLLLLDEPSMGLAPVLVDLIFDTIQTIREQGTTVLVVEQNALAALRIADYAYLIESGNLKMEGSGVGAGQERRHRARLPRRLSAARGRRTLRARRTPPAVRPAELPVAGVSRSPETARPRARRSSRRVPRPVDSGPSPGVRAGCGVRRGRPTSRRLA